MKKVFISFLSLITACSCAVCALALNNGADDPAADGHRSDQGNSGMFGCGLRYDDGDHPGHIRTQRLHLQRSGPGATGGHRRCRLLLLRHKENHPGCTARLLQDRRYEDGGEERREKSAYCTAAGGESDPGRRDTAGEARRIQKVIAGRRPGLRFGASLLA